MTQILIVTGLIGSGKSTVVKCFENEGIPTLDADTIAHQLYRDTNHPICQQIIQKFGQQIVINSQIDRKLLRQALHSKQDWEYLENLVNPLIHSTLVNFVKNNQHHPLVVIEVSVMNTLPFTQFDTLLVKTNLATQIERVKARSGLSEDEIMFRINKQKQLLENVLFNHEIENNNLTTTKIIVSQITKFYIHNHQKMI